MKTKLTFQHLSGLKANREDTVELPATRQIVLGRDPDCDVRYDQREELVSRKHMKIVATDEQPARYMAIDLGSRNGTFVNRQRVFGGVLLGPGSRVQLGAGGPEFLFGPATNALLRRTIRELRVGRQVWIVLLLLAASAVGYALWSKAHPLWQSWRSSQQARENQARLRAAALLASIGTVTAEWNLFDVHTGAALSRVFIPNERVSHASLIPLLEGAPSTLPAFVLGADHRIRPLLMPATSSKASQPLGGRWSTPGVTVYRGDTLTAQPRRMPWQADWHWPPEELAGALFVPASDGQTGTEPSKIAPLSASQFPAWLPSDSAYIVDTFPANLDDGLRVRSASHSDFSIRVTAVLKKNGHMSRVELRENGPGLWVAEVHSSDGSAETSVAHLSSGPLTFRENQPVRVVGTAIESDRVRQVRPDGTLELQGSQCERGGGVFDSDQDRLLALCVPDLEFSGHAGTAIPINPQTIQHGDRQDVHHQRR